MLPLLLNLGVWGYCFSKIQEGILGMLLLILAANLTVISNHLLGTWKVLYVVHAQNLSPALIEKELV